MGGAEGAQDRCRIARTTSGSRGSPRVAGKLGRIGRRLSMCRSDRAQPESKENTCALEVDRGSSVRVSFPYVTTVVLVPLVLQLIVPAALITWLASARHASLVAWLLALVLSAAWIGTIAAAGLWLVLPWYLPLVYTLLLVVAGVRSSRGGNRRIVWPRGVPRGAAVVVLGVMAAGAVALLAVALSGRRPPGALLELASPLGAGTYLVANGGSNVLVSAHVQTLDDSRFRRARGQSYGVDLVRIDAAGLRASGILPRDPAHYAIFGDTIYAPCAGNVIFAIDGFDDLPVPVMDREHLAGNHVLLECGGAWVLLAHMRKGSVQVAEGAHVALGQALGTVGNTGNSSEPHLHIHAQRPGTLAEPLSGEPLPISIGGRYLVRGQRVRW